ncbi:hypothetical protein FO488_00135 [Geobacter sp. FeAm09]|uniref:hypothetical protein n=1 Tax=Geobacter sp. FeAm09 TaxID=2597769 RepID=UPI0011EF26F6|nr:hypothetical protein [Geobacter sp. FeAm09]QEM66716.1 hypothetical protein FO488_00135 [Geobacter sp. FeAm09]
MQQLDVAIIEDWLSKNTIFCERLNGRFSAKQCPQRSYSCEGCPRGVDSKKAKLLQKMSRNRRTLAAWPSEEIDTMPPEILEPTMSVTVQLLNARLPKIKRAAA